MRSHILAGLALVALASSPARAEHRKWQGVFVGSVSVALVGGALFWHGSSQIDHAEERLCTGAYADTCDHAVPTDPSEVERLNDNGDRGSKLVMIGGGMMLAGGLLGAVALYKGFIADGEREPQVTVAPTVSRDGAGASFQLRW